MTDKGNKRLGFDPLKGRDTQRGVDSLIRQTTQEAHGAQDAHSTHDTQNTQRTQKLPRINMAFEIKHLDYLRVMAGIAGISITAYVNSLIASDMAARRDRYEQGRALKQEDKR